MEQKFGKAKKLKNQKSKIKNHLGHTWYNTTYNLGF
jgi:hypothetical protein